MIRVLIADDHVIVRRGLRQILEDASDIKLTGEASNGKEVLKALRENWYDVIVLDVSMPEATGLDVLSELRKMHPRPKALMLSMYPEKQFAIRAIRSGASGYLTKDSAPEELLTAIREVASGRKYITHQLAEILADEILLDTERPAHELLSDRESQVLRLLARGKGISEIAGELSLSPKTISTYRTRILEKLHLNNTAEIIRYALDWGIVE
ncbi:MAG: response regulator transcription factor [Chloroflexota bacterium]